MLKLLEHVCGMALSHVFMFTSILFFVCGGLFTFVTRRDASRRGRLLVDLADHRRN